MGTQLHKLLKKGKPPLTFKYGKFRPKFTKGNNRSLTPTPVKKKAGNAPPCPLQKQFLSLQIYIPFTARQNWDILYLDGQVLINGTRKTLKLKLPMKIMKNTTINIITVLIVIITRTTTFNVRRRTLELITLAWLQLIMDTRKRPSPLKWIHSPESLISFGTLNAFIPYPFSIVWDSSLILTTWRRRKQMIRSLILLPTITKKAWLDILLV